MVLIEEKTSALAGAVRDLRGATESKLANHETRLTRIETLIEIARPDGNVLRIAPSRQVSEQASPGSESKDG